MDLQSLIENHSIIRIKDTDDSLIKDLFGDCKKIKYEHKLYVFYPDENSLELIDQELTDRNIQFNFYIDTKEKAKLAENLFELKNRSSFRYFT